MRMIRACRIAKIGFTKDKMHAMGFAKARDIETGEDVVFHDIVLDCPDMPEWHGFSLPVQREMELLGITMDRKLSWRSHVTKCVKKADRLMTRLRMCVRDKWGLGSSVVKRLWKGALEPVMLNGVAVWGKALERKTVVRQMRSVQRKAALAMTRCFKTTKAEVALALAGLTPVDLVAKELVVLQYSHGILRGRMEELRDGCAWSPHLAFVRQLMLEAGVELGGSFERRLVDWELPYPPERKPLDITLGRKEEWAEELIQPRPGVGVVYTDGSKKESGVGAAFVAQDPEGQNVGQGLFKLPDYCSNYQAEAVAQREGVIWTKEVGHPGVQNWVIASDGGAVLASMKGQRRMTSLVGEVVREAGEGHSFVYVPGHRGHAGNEMADALAKEATVSGRRVEVEIPRAYTRRQCRDRSWQLWSQEWEALEDGTGMDGGGAKVYLQFMPTLGCLRDKVWRGKAGGRRVLQLLSGHCNVGGYLASVKKQESGSCGYCGLEEEDVHHYLLRCPRWYMQRLEMDDLIVRGDPRSSLGNMFRELERLARYAKRTGRLDF